MAIGDELAVITAVVLGGADIFGGRGTIFGTVVALFLLGAIRRAMGVANVAANMLLLVSVSRAINPALLQASARVMSATRT